MSGIDPGDSDRPTEHDPDVHGPDRHAIPTPALALGLGGLLPFAAGAVLAWLPHADLAAIGLAALGAYGAVILSFLGGVRWGAALFDEAALARWSPLVLAVLPSLVAWVALLVPPVPRLALLLAGLVGQWALDRGAVREGALPGWYGRLRAILTAGAGAATLAGLVAALARGA